MGVTGLLAQGAAGGYLADATAVLPFPSSGMGQKLCCYERAE